LNAVILAEVKELLSKRQSSRSDAELSVDSQDLLTVHQLCKSVSTLLSTRNVSEATVLGGPLLSQ
jgi:hypothetical protein